MIVYVEVNATMDMDGLAEALVRLDTRILLVVEEIGTANVAEITLPPETAELTTIVCSVFAGADDDASVIAVAIPVVPRYDGVGGPSSTAVAVATRGGTDDKPVMTVAVAAEFCALVTVLATVGLGSTLTAVVPVTT